MANGTVFYAVSITMEVQLDAVQVRPLTVADIDAAHALEVECFPPDEAASKEDMTARLTEAGDLFLGGFLDNKLVAFINGTRTDSKTLTEESMHCHVPTGETLCIHSVSVHTPCRRKGLASHMLQKYIGHVRENIAGVSSLQLIAHDELVPLYTKAGFEHVGLSPVVYGSRPWQDCILRL
eukprot:m.487693 g.487693  ORF g.487693 m.487693 type:complete len:180 (+) comp25208_c0_seq1:112-651(+)